MTLAIPALVMLTSILAGAFGVRRLGLPVAGLGAAAARMLEAVGVTLLFFGVNVAVAGVAVMTTRLGLGGFVTFYRFDDVTLPVLSLLQGLVFQRWREGR